MQGFRYESVAAAGAAKKDQRPAPRARHDLTDYPLTPVQSRAGRECAGNRRTPETGPASYVAGLSAGAVSGRRSRGLLGGRRGLGGSGTGWALGSLALGWLAFGKAAAGWLAVGWVARGWLVLC